MVGGKLHNFAQVLLRPGGAPFRRGIVAFSTPGRGAEWSDLFGVLFRRGEHRIVAVSTPERSLKVCNFVRVLLCL